MPKSEKLRRRRTKTTCLLGNSAAPAKKKSHFQGVVSEGRQTCPEEEWEEDVSQGRRLALENERKPVTSNNLKNSEGQATSAPAPADVHAPDNRGAWEEVKRKRRRTKPPGLKYARPDATIVKAKEGVT